MGIIAQQEGGGIESRVEARTFAKCGANEEPITGRCDAQTGAAPSRSRAPSSRAALPSRAARARAAQPPTSRHASSCRTTRHVRGSLA